MLLNRNPRVRATEERGDGVNVVLSKHALDRFRDRGGRGLSRSTAEQQLSGMWELVEFVVSPPDWVHETWRDPNPLFAVIADMVLPLRELEDEPGTYIAATTLFRGNQFIHKTKKSKPAAGARKRRGGRPRIEDEEFRSWAA